ncbi:MAG: aminotransferase class III-fold pyridoxal phosphate-dependent enzyme [Rhodospirillales bacterium]|nr:aminotransferase class III-fold pyridoxal phosphate-dependent enzyme [Rhodospirillales bacterium]
MSKVLDCGGHAIKIPNIVKSEGAHLFDDRGKRYLDLESGVWCMSLGHNHSRINQTIKDQIDSITHTGFCYSSSIVEEAAETVLDIANFKDGKCVFLSSGSEAIELARQATRHLAGKGATLSLHDGYFGSFSSTINRENGWCLFDWSDCRDCRERDNCNVACEKLKSIPGDISEFLFEPGSASGFVRFPTASMVQNLVAAVRDRGGKIIANEVTTGMGRTGKWFGHNHHQIDPDIIAIGKGVGNGYPVSVVAMNRQTAREVENSSFKYMQSHQNDPLAAAVANAVIKTLMDEDLISRAETLGGKFSRELEKLVDGKIVTRVRARGMMFAIEFSGSDVSDRLYEALLENGYIVCNRNGLFRIDPPLTIDEGEFLGFVEKFRELLALVAA